MKNIKALSEYLHNNCGFKITRAEKIAQAALHNFRIEQANVLAELKLKSDGWKIICVDGQPGEITFGALKNKTESFS